MKGAASVTVSIGSKELVLEAGHMAHQAAGACTVRVGETVVFSAATFKDPREGIDYFPLQVEYREKYYAAGRFPGGFFKRESKPSEKEILTARITDRPIRPLFPADYRNEVQVYNMLLSADGENDADTISVVAGSAALVLSEIPFQGPVAAVRVGRVAGAFVVNPTHAQREKSDLDLVYASTRDLPQMIEGEAREISEADIIAAMKLAHAECVKIIDAQTELRRLLGLPAKAIAVRHEDRTLIAAARELAGAQYAGIMLAPGKQERAKREAEMKTRLKAGLLERFPALTDEQFRRTLDSLEIEVVRRNLLERGKRIDGRAFDEIRPLAAQVGILPRTHGSAMFNRGETQALATVTLGTGLDTQRLDAVSGGEEEKKFMLHYNFPPFSVGECGRIGAPGRREIGHGALAERSLAQVVSDDYPYTIRLVSEIMSSNGSSSMASVCAGSLALMDAGIPITAPVAGVSVGLFTGPDRTELVTDIIGAEDHCGDMDFKVAGTRKGITGFQVDLKIPGLKWEIVERAFAQAREGRMKILDFMAAVITEPRSELSRHAPRIQELKIPVDKIGGLIGPGGKNIRRITDLSGAQIDIEEDGTVKIFAVEAGAMEIAVREVSLISAEVEEGKIYEGRVTGVKEFGCFVEVLPGKDGLVHISELSDRRIRDVEEVCKLGDTITVKCIGVDERGRVRLSRRAAMLEKDGAGAPPGDGPADERGHEDRPRYDDRDRRQDDERPQGHERDRRRSDDRDWNRGSDRERARR
ncbi:MAG: polyribonucleotide nucleotidyltransferase [Verrucomicrobiota bacterium]|nr:polyribonucleotide nucleotidyltransferase [Verrucomicrobiota bacterium]